VPVSLTERLKDLIRREGAISFHDWMKAALYDPEGGYYQRSDRTRWGRQGDYRTSPERSELFAATFARYFAGLADQNLAIVECGAGDGSFAFGVLSTLRDQCPRYIVYDVSEDALSLCRERLADFADRVEFYSDWDLVSVNHGIVFANELLDAFPVHRVLKSQEGLSEFYVNVDEGDEFAWTTGPLTTPRLTEFSDAHSLELANGQVIEINLGIDDWLAQVAAKLEDGFVITVDYGAEAVELYDPIRRPQGTLRGFSRHGFVDDLLVQPGAYDLTASVNWTQVKATGARLGFEVIEFASQDKFLLKAGLLDQLESRLSRAETESEKTALTIGAREMILPGGMASSFQVLVQKRRRPCRETLS
jgi:SAM-dependent MidA family methyltransferase